MRIIRFYISSLIIFSFSIVFCEDRGIKFYNSNKAGVAQVLNRLNYIAMISHLRRLNTPIEKSTHAEIVLIVFGFAFNQSINLFARKA